MVDTRLSVLKKGEGSTCGLLFASGVVVIVLLLLASTASAETDPRFSIGLGTFFIDRDTKTSIDGEAGSGTDVDLESDLGLDKSDTVFRVNSVKFDVAVDKSRFQGNLDWQYDGALAYLKFDF